ncbi:MAG: L-glutamate gamma-semialdehyde dehydrogenase [Dermatophilaceae bacterium]
MDGYPRVPAPANEPVLDYAPGSPQRAALQSELGRIGAERVELPSTIGGRAVVGKGRVARVVQPHAHRKVLGTMRLVDGGQAAAAVAAAKAAAGQWRDLDFADRAAILLKAAELLAGPWRATLNAATMLGQSKTVVQAEIDSACELVDFWRINTHFAEQILREQPPLNSRGVWNRTDYRSLEGFVYAVTPFNFTAIGGNLPTAPALMGNTVVWKPARTQQLAAHYTMLLLQAAGLPPGVINLVISDGATLTDAVLADPDFAGLHFTGSTRVFQSMWSQVGQNIARYKTYPRLVGETGGKDFVVAHPSADLDVLRTALVRGAFEFQGQKCSAASRAYVPASLWRRLRGELADEVEALTQGDVTDFATFMGAVIDADAFAEHRGAIDRARATPGIRIVAGGRYDDTEGYFVRPTVLQVDDPNDEALRTEYFGPILSVHVYPDRSYPRMLEQMESAAPYALTGSIIAQDRAAIVAATRVLRYAAGNFYVNDKPTGAVVGQQPFGGGRASGTNDKAGAAQNLLRWTSVRSIKETFAPPTDYRYPSMG